MRRWLECSLLCVCCLQGLNAGFLSRLPDWRIACGELVLRAAPGMPAEQHNTALINALRQLCDGEWVASDGGPVMSLESWPWTPDMLKHYTQAMPALRERGLAEHTLRLDTALTDELLSACVEVGACTASLARSLCHISKSVRELPHTWTALLLALTLCEHSAVRLPHSKHREPKMRRVCVPPAMITTVVVLPVAGRAAPCALDST